jgi:hypothetical protein
VFCKLKTNKACIKCNIFSCYFALHQPSFKSEPKFSSVLKFGDALLVYVDLFNVQ